MAKQAEHRSSHMSYLTTSFNHASSPKHIALLNYYEKRITGLQKRYQEVKENIKRVEGSLQVDLSTNENPFECNPKATRVIFCGLDHHLSSLKSQFNTERIDDRAPKHHLADQNTLWVFFLPGKNDIQMAEHRRSHLSYLTTSFNHTNSPKNIALLNYYDKRLSRLQKRYQEVKENVERVEKSLEIDINTSESPFERNPKATRIIFCGLNHHLSSLKLQFQTERIDDRAPKHYSADQNTLWVFFLPGKNDIQEVADQLQSAFVKKQKVLFIKPLSTTGFAEELWDSVPEFQERFGGDFQKWKEFMLSHTVKPEFTSILHQFIVDVLNQCCLQKPRMKLSSEINAMAPQIQSQESRMREEPLCMEENVARDIFCYADEIKQFVQQWAIEDAEDNQNNKSAEPFKNRTSAIFFILRKISMRLVSNFAQRYGQTNMAVLNEKIMKAFESKVPYHFFSGIVPTTENTTNGFFQKIISLIYGERSISVDDFSEQLTESIKENAHAIAVEVCKVFALKEKISAAESLNTELLFIELEVNGLLRSITGRDGQSKGHRKPLESSVEKELLSLSYVKAFGFLFGVFHVHVSDEGMKTHEQQKLEFQGLENTLTKHFGKDGFRIVQQSAQFELTPFNIRPGSQLCQNTPEQYGSLGAFAYDSVDDKVYGLTGAHVVLRNVVVKVVCPDEHLLDLGTCKEKISFTGSSVDQGDEAVDLIDIAAVEINSNAKDNCVWCYDYTHGRGCDFRPYIYSGRLDDLTGFVVEKCGASDRDGLKQGIIVGMDYCFKYTLFGNVKNVILISGLTPGEEFSVPGDSGSVIWWEEILREVDAVVTDTTHQVCALAMVYGGTNIPPVETIVSPYAHKVFEGMTSGLPLTVAFGLKEALPKLYDKLPNSRSITLIRPSYRRPCYFLYLLPMALLGGALATGVFLFCLRRRH
ncbi:uncharacterized protein LOC106168405 [Lingula anatina]|uniref:Uncharacterized protein LOC106168405 n=1 Tax=Lingula anatina TaxID=7574 RepID=A0A1S3IXG9_LINAN|nr:uncharacterized protein LOC106168405 [Lingula anatina]|eukprot:XP_013402895.1 uncharacterized protein LOC106168405 [Lingula anatina]